MPVFALFDSIFNSIIVMQRYLITSHSSITQVGSSGKDSMKNFQGALNSFRQGNYFEDQVERIETPTL
jgi:hypothetical protein